VALIFVLPPSLGSAKAEARAELIRTALEPKLGELMTMHVATSYSDIEERIQSGLAHIVWAPAAVTAKLPAARAVFTIAREGRTSYHSAIVARKSARLDLTALQGKKAAWVDPLSAGGYLLAAARLRAEGIDLSRTFASQIFVGSHRAAVEAVLLETADITAVSSYEKDSGAMVERMRWYAGPAGDKLTPIAFTESCLNDAIVLPATLEEGRANRIIQNLVPKTQSGMVRSRFLGALEADGLVSTPLADYHKLAPLLTPHVSDERGSSPPSERPSRPSRPPRSSWF
jgi:ABC-type phosphate/phosphonate transport system substrate-binding protein